MNSPTNYDITAALKAIEAAELPEDHPRVIARQRVNEWRSNAEREGWPVSNVHDVHGAPLLDKDAVVRGSYPTYRAELIEGKSWWRRLFRR